MVGFIKRLHPEGFPWPVSRLYAILTGTSVLEAFYSHLAKDISAQAGLRARVLDIGTGPGRLPILLHNRRKDLKIVGIDISEDMVKIAGEAAGKAGASGIRFITANADSLPFPDSSFDIVVSSASMHHWKKPGRVFAEMRRMLRKNGRAIVWDLASDAPRRSYYALLPKFGWLRGLAIFLHYYLQPFIYSKAEAMEFARKAGFRAKASRYSILFKLEMRRA